MGSVTQNSGAILDVCRVAPAPNSPELSQPLAFFDCVWLRFNPPQRIFFYRLSDSSPTHFNSVIVPKRKRSLSLTLNHFSLLAGRLTWPPEDLKPTVVFKPNQDSVSLTIAQSQNPESFTHLIGNKPRKATESRLYVPELHATDSEAAIISLQVTLFQSHGVAIGISAHHAVLDGKSTTLFLKAWAYINKHLHTDVSSSEEPSLPPELAPFLDRSVVQDPEGLYLEYIEMCGKVRFPGLSPRSLNLLPVSGMDPNLVRANFDVSKEDVRKLRELVSSKLGINESTDREINETLHLSTFVLVFSYSWTCLVKAKNMESSSKVRYIFAAESRVRMDPPIPENYLGNCIIACTGVLEAEVVKGEAGFAVLSKSVGDSIKELAKKSVHQVAKDNLEILRDGESKCMGVSGSPRFEVYKADFGWGRPAKVEITSIDRDGCISLAEARDGSGGVEVGLVLTKEEMEVFGSLFVGGLKDFSG